MNLASGWRAAIDYKQLNEITEDIGKIQLPSLYLELPYSTLHEAELHTKRAPNDTYVPGLVGCSVKW